MEGVGKEAIVQRRDGGKRVPVRVRVSATGRDVLVKVGEQDHVAVLVGKVRDAAKVSRAYGIAKPLH